MKLFALSIVFLFLTKVTLAENYFINFYGQEYYGVNVISLKDRLANQYPQIPWYQTQIHTVNILAKTITNASARLTSGARSSQSYVPSVSYAAYYNQSIQSYTNIYFTPGYSEDHRVLLHLSGNIKLYNVMVSTNTIGRGGNPGRR